jgi:hypothetical protein
MKKLASYAFLAIVFFLLGCSTSRKNSIARAPKSEFQVENDVIMHKGKPYAKLQAMTWSLDNGELVKEMNFKLLDKEDLSVIGGMIDFLSDRHQGDEIEVEFDVPSGSDQFKL